MNLPTSSFFNTTTGGVVRSRLPLKIDAPRQNKTEAERCDAFFMFGDAWSLDSCLAFNVLVVD